MTIPANNPAIATVDRKVWHSLVELAVQSAQRRGGPVDIDELLNAVGLFSWAPGREQARAYAEKLLAATNNHP